MEKMHFGAKKLNFARIRLVTRLQVRRTYKQFAIPLLSIVLLTITLLSLFMSKQSYTTGNDEMATEVLMWNQRHLLSAQPNEPTSASNSTTNRTFACSHSKGVCSDNCTSEFPKDIFTCEQKRKGAIVFHVLGLIYMFIALAIVCDEFFVPSLYCIIDRLQISEDVAGATFLAVGISAPEVAISIIGTFMGKSNVGIGTIVGSAVFNFLFIISICAFFNKSDALLLSWWPLFRDVLFYGVSLTVLIIVFLDSKIHFYEAFVLIICYVNYVIFMKFNNTIENAVKRGWCCKNPKINDNSLSTAQQDNHVNLNEQQNEFNGTMVPTNLSDTNNQQTVAHDERPNITMVPSSVNRFRHTVFQLMIHSVNAVDDQQDNAEKLKNTSAPRLANVVKSVSIVRNGNKKRKNPRMQFREISKARRSQSDESVGQNSQKTVISTIDIQENANNEKEKHGVTFSLVTSTTMNQSTSESEEIFVSKSNVEEVVLENEENTEKPLDLSWPSSTRERITYLFCAPLLFLFWATLIDVRKKKRSKYFAWTFIGSIFWIGGFSFLMVWWATMIGETIEIPEGIMGLTLLAAGTSIPDMLTSIIVVQKGYGDMAVSSSFGSNIFDITVGLPLPWFFYTLTILPNPVDVSSKGMFCSILLLFFMLLVKVSTFISFKWRLTKGLGAAMLTAYFIFIILSVLLEFSIIRCPF